MDDIKNLFEELNTALNKLKNSYKDKIKKNNYSDRFGFNGISNLEIENIVKDFRKKHPTLEKDRLFRLTDKLWQSSLYEEKTLAIKLLKTYNSYLSLKDMVLIERMLGESLDLNHISEIALYLVSAILIKNKKAFDYLKNWSNSTNLSLRKASLLSQILLVKNGKVDKELFLKLIKNNRFFKDNFSNSAMQKTN